MPRRSREIRHLVLQDVYQLLQLRHQIPHIHRESSQLSSISDFHGVS